MFGMCWLKSAALFCAEVIQDVLSSSPVGVSFETFPLKLSLWGIFWSFLYAAESNSLVQFLQKEQEMRVGDLGLRGAINIGGMGIFLMTGVNIDLISFN